VQFAQERGCWRRDEEKCSSDQFSTMSYPMGEVQELTGTAQQEAARSPF